MIKSELDVLRGYESEYWPQIGLKNFQKNLNLHLVSNFSEVNKC